VEVGEDAAGVADVVLARRDGVQEDRPVQPFHHEIGAVGFEHRG
jgi:hypothetical protein